MLATQVLVCLPIGWVEVLEVLRIVYRLGYLCACLSVGLKCWKFCACWMHRYLCTYRLVEVLEVLRMLATQVLVCLPIGWVEVLEVLRMLDAQVLVYLSIGLKCWKFCA